MVPISGTNARKQTQHAHTVFGIGKLAGNGAVPDEGV
jgi:hypothetical protein